MSNKVVITLEPGCCPGIFLEESIDGGVVNLL